MRIARGVNPTKRWVYAGGRKREGRRPDSRGGGNWGKITPHSVMFCNRKTQEAEPELKETGGETFDPDIELNIYSPNDQVQQVQFLKSLSNSVLNKYANERVVLGGDFNCAINEIDKHGGRPIEHKKAVIREINNEQS